MLKALSALGLLLAFWVSAQANARQNFKDYPVLTGSDDIEWSFDMPDRVAAIGDTHSDPDALATILEHIEFMSPDGEWTAGKDHLVLMGDLVGKGPYSRANWQFAIDLKAKARKKGGTVHILVGNHELSVEEGLYATHLGQDDFWAYNDFAPFITYEQKNKLSEYEKVLRGMKAMGVAWADPKSPYAAELVTRNSIIRIGDIVFAHGGLSDYFLDAPATHIDSINYTYRQLIIAIQKALLGDKTAMDAFADMQWLYHASGNGPMWTREIAKEEYSSDKLASMLATLASRKLVIGHSPTERRIIDELYKGKVFNIDTGISRAIAGGNLSAMVFHKGGRHDVYNKIHRSTLHPVAQALRNRFQPKYEVSAFRKVWTCFEQVALRDGVLNAFQQD